MLVTDAKLVVTDIALVVTVAVIIISKTNDTYSESACCNRNDPKKSSNYSDYIGIVMRDHKTI